MKQYLLAIQKNLSLPVKQQTNILTEVEQHLRDEVYRLQLQGMPAHVAEKIACEQFGSATVVAQRFNKVHKWFFNSPKRVMFGVLGYLFLQYVVFTVIFNIVLVRYMNIMADQFSYFMLVKSVITWALLPVLCVLIFKRLSQLAILRQGLGWCILAISLMIAGWRMLSLIIEMSIIMFLSHLNVEIIAQMAQYQLPAYIMQASFELMIMAVTFGSLYWWYGRKQIQRIES